MKNVADIWPLAPLQVLMLAHGLSEQDSQLLVEQFHCTIRGALDPLALRTAWETIVSRQALLRAAPAWEGLKKPVQVVRRQVELPWTEHDWCDLSRDDRVRRQETLLAKSRRQGFDLSRPPLVRFHLARTGADEWLFVWTCHHLVLDGWSVGIVLREVFACYEQLCSRTIPQLPASGTFATYLKWLVVQDPAAGEEFWREQLRDFGAPLPLPLDDAPQRTPAADGTAPCELKLDEADSAGLAQVAHSRRVSRSALVEAAWAILLTRHAERDDCIFGVTVSGRPPQVPEVDTIVGPFANNVPRRVRISLDEPLVTLWQQLHSRQVDSQPFEHCSLQQIATAADRAEGRLFDTLVVYENYPLQDTENWRAGNVTIRDLHGTATSNYPLSLIAWPGREMSLRLLYDDRRYSAETSTQLLQQVATLLRGMAHQPDALVRDLALVERADVASFAANNQKAPTLHVLDAARQPAPADMPGDLWVATQASTRSAIVDPLHPSEKQFLRPTGYRAAVCADGELEFLGPTAARAANAVRVGRYSVDTAEVAAVLAISPLVAQASIVGYTDRAGRGQLAAYVVPVAESAFGVAADQTGLVLGELRRFLADRLPEPMVPRAWRAVDRLPFDAAGNLDTSALPPPVSPRGESSHPYVAPRDEWELRVAAIWSQVLSVEPIGVTDGFLDLGGHSSLAVALLARLDEAFGRRLPLAALFEEPTVAHLAELLRTAQPTNESSLLVPIRPSGSDGPLFCIHPAGGTVFCYVELAQHLSPDVPLYGLQAQGIDGTLAPHDSVPAMAAEYIQAVRTIQPSGPYRLCGWSTGGVLAFEMARQLLADEQQVSLVALVDAAIPRPDQALDENDLVPMLQMMFPGEDPHRLQALRNQPLSEQVDYFRERALAARLLLAGSDARGARSVFDVFEANMKAAVAYQPRALATRLTLIRASEQATPMHADPLLGWGPWATAGIDVHVVQGTHMEMLQPPSVIELAQVLTERLVATTKATEAYAVT